MNNKHYMRQLDIFDPIEYSEYGVNIVGCGAIGSMVGHALARMGLAKMILWDSDNIETHNLPNQWFHNSSIGNPKSRMLSESLRGITTHDNKTFSFEYLVSNVDKDSHLGYPITMVCTDSITSREEIYQVAKSSGNLLLIDGRMGGKVFTVFTVDLTDPLACKAYEATFHEDTEQSCTNRAIIYNTMGVAGIMANQLTKVLHNDPYPFEINFCYENYVIKSKGLPRRKKLVTS